MPDPTPDPIANEVNEVLENPMTAKVLKGIVTWLLSAHPDGPFRRLTSVIRAAIIWAVGTLGYHGSMGTDQQSMIEQIVAWILGSGVTITWALHLFHDRIIPVVNQWIDKRWPPVKVTK